MDRVSVAFHKNVSLLTRTVPPNSDFKKYFKEGMFDKPNTTGFIHVSYYLLSIYYKDNVKNKVPWPVICKQTESQFRNDMRKCLTIVASENPDVNFPPILASHLLHAGGTKFLLIMWKFSLVVLRTHLKKEHNSIIAHAPNPGPCQELTMTYLKNVTSKHENMISDIQQSRENCEQEAQSFLKKKTIELNEVKERVLKLMENLKDTINHSQQANSAAKTKLIIIESKAIVDMWINYTVEQSKSYEETCKSFEKLNNVLKYVNSIVSNINGNSQTLNALNFDKINTEPLYELIPPEKQVILYGFYNEENCLNLGNFFSIINLLIQKCSIILSKNNVQEICLCSDHLLSNNKLIKDALDHFQCLHKQMLSFFNTELKNNRKLKDPQGSLANAPEYAKVLFMPSPSFQININNNGGTCIYSQNDIRLTPAESAHKDLFARYAQSHKSTNLSKRKYPVLKINFDEETSSMDLNSFKQLLPQPRHPKYENSFKNVAKYSRLFSGLRPNYNKVNNSMISMMSTNSVIPPMMPKENNISLMDSCNSSQEFSKTTPLSIPNANSTIEPTKLEEKAPPKNNKRRSISDLVERYKSIVQKRDNN